MLENKKLNDVETNEVSGGGTTVKVPEEFYKHFKEVTRKCRMCGKEFTREEYTGPISMLPTGPFTDSWSYYRDLCDDCAKQHPYKDRYEQFVETISKSKPGN